MTDIPLTNGERTLIVLLVGAQLNAVKDHNEMRGQASELLSILNKIEPGDRQLFVRVP